MLKATVGGLSPPAADETHHKGWSGCSNLPKLRTKRRGSPEHLLRERLERPEADRSADTSARIGATYPNRELTAKR